jgi:phosphate transport system substrate-binding protein
MQIDRNITLRGAFFVLVPALLLVLSGCGGGATENTGPVNIRGVGASAPAPLYQRWIEQFQKERPEVHVTYEPTSSADGVRELAAGTADFAAVDAPLTDEQLASMTNPVLHFPTLIEATAVVYNIPSASSLRMTGELLARLYLGQQQWWDDIPIERANPRVDLPAQRIVVIHRSDESSSTAAFTEYLESTSPTWAERVGSGSTVDWPQGVAVEGDDAMAARVQSTPYSIGYVELNYAVNHNLKYVTIQNASGEFVTPSFESIGAAISDESVPEDFRQSIVNSKNKGAYPIASLNWIVAPNHIADPAKRDAMTRFLLWIYTSGDNIILQEFNYGILPLAVGERAMRQVNRIQTPTK